MTHKMVRIAMVAALLLVAVVAVAQAQEPRPMPSGTLSARGDGFVQLGGRGRVEIQGHGSGIIWVGQGSVSTEGSGERFDLGDKGVLLVAWSGKVTVSGEKLSFRTISHRIEFTATGAGVAFLKGTGTYTKGNGETGEWTAEGVRVRYGLPTVIKGSGTLTVQGSGTAAVRGNGRVEITGHGDGVIAIRGASNIKIEGTSDGQAAARPRAGATPEAPKDRVVLRNFTGKVAAEGSQMEVGIRSNRVDLTAHGTGVVVLKGSGSYQVGDQSGNWTDEGLRIELTP